jgi:hypothetical protein
VLYPEPNSTARLIFPYLPAKPAKLPKLISTPPSRYLWMRNPGGMLLETVPDFLVFFPDPVHSGSPLFQTVGADVIRCNADILTSSLWTLARLEESQTKSEDEHGRFPARASLAYRFNCLDRPIVDEYALAFRQALSCLFPRWEPATCELKAKLSHDIDLTGLPRSLRSTIGHLWPRAIPGAFFRDALSLAGMGFPAYLQAVIETARISRDAGFDSAFYWKASRRTSWDSGYDPRDRRIQGVIGSLLQQGFEMGIHPGYETFAAPNEFQAEVARLRRVVGSGPLGGRQHFLRWRPSTWRVWEQAELAYDSSVGFADAMGFRAGTAVPYHPWLMEEDRESGLLEIPLVVMDCTPIQYMRLETPEIVSRIAAIVNRCRATGSVFTLLWHNSSVIEQPYASLYPRVLDLLPRHSYYDWKADLALQPLPSSATGDAALDLEPA